MPVATICVERFNNPWNVYTYEPWLPDSYNYSFNNNKYLFVLPKISLSCYYSQITSRPHNQFVWHQNHEDLSPNKRRYLRGDHTAAVIVRRGGELLFCGMNHDRVEWVWWLHARKQSVDQLDESRTSSTAPASWSICRFLRGCISLPSFHHRYQ